MKRSLANTACLAVLWILTFTSAEAAQYRMVDLGPGGAIGINNNGQIVGYSLIADTFRLCVWQGETITYMDTFTGSNDGYSYDINGAGQAVGYSFNSSDHTHACLWNNGSITDLGTLPGGISSGARDINESGQAVGYSSNSTGYELAVLWQDGIAINIGPGYAKSINDDSYIVGGSPYNTLVWTWKNGVRTDLGTLDQDYCYIWPTGLNDMETIVGYAYTYEHKTQAWAWQDGILTELCTFGGPNWAQAINNHGQIVGHSCPSDDAWESDHACLWQDGTIIDLGTLGTYSSATDINDNGWICGESRDADGMDHAVLWIPVPEPSSIFTLFCGIGGIGGIAWRQRK